jgi:hypothetical protein
MLWDKRNRLDSGHFVAEDCLAEISSNIPRFYLERVEIKDKQEKVNLHTSDTILSCYPVLNSCV